MSLACSQCGNPVDAPDTRVCPSCLLRAGLATAGELYAAHVASGDGSDTERFRALCDANPEHATELRTLHEIALAARRQDSTPGPVAAGGPSPLDSAWPSGSRYRVEGIVARGGMGIVYAVRDRELDRQLAMKVIGKGASHRHPIPMEQLPPAWVDRFVEEAQITAQLDHPGIVPVHEIGLDPEGRLYFTMKLVKGRRLDQIFVLARQKLEGWNLSRAVRALLQACEAVAHAHEHGVIHRDLKPENIMVGRLGEVYVMDWGVAHSMRRRDVHELRPRLAPSDDTSRPNPAPSAPPPSDSPVVTLDGTVLGTPAYMSPEHARGSIGAIGPHSDVYSLGAVLYQLLTGHGPYLDSKTPPSSTQVLEAVLRGPPTPVERLAGDQPQGLVAICAKAMERDSSARYASATELAEDLRAWLDRRVVRAHQTGALAELEAWIRRNPLAAFTQAATVTLLVTGLLVVIALQDRAKSEVARGNAALERSNRDLRDAIFRAHVGQAADASRHDDADNLEALLEATDTSLRSWEWLYLRWQLPDAHTVPSPVAGRDVRAVLAHDASWLVTATVDGSLHVLDAPAMSPRRPPIALPDSPCILALSPDQRTVAVGTPRGLLRLLNLADGSSRWTAVAHPAQVRSLAFDDTGTRLASGGEDGSLAVWDTTTGARLATTPLGGKLLSTAFRPHGHHLVACNTLTGAQLLDAETLRVVRKFGDARQSDAAAAFHPDGSRLATAGAGGIVRIWRTDTGEPVAAFEFPASTNTLWSLAWSPDGERIATASSAQLILVLDATSGHIQERIASAKHAGWLPSLQFSSDSRWILASGNRSPGGNRLCFVAPHRRVTPVAAHSNWVWSAAFTPDSRKLVTSGFDGRLILSDADDGRTLRTFTGHTNSVVWSVAVTPDGRRAVSGGQDGTVRVWDLETGTEESTLRAQPYPESDDNVTLCVAVSHDGQRIASGGVDGQVILWNLHTGDRLWAARSHTNRLWSLAWSPDDARLAVGGYQGSLTVWDTKRAAVLWQTNLLTPNIGSVAFRPDGQELLTAHWNGILRLWDPADGRMVRSIVAQEPLTRSAAYSPDGLRIASGGFGQQVRIWDRATGESLLALPREPGSINFVTFSPDGKRLVSCNSDTLARVWQTERSTGRPGRDATPAPITGETSSSGKVDPPAGRD